MKQTCLVFCLTFTVVCLNRAAGWYYFHTEVEWTSNLCRVQIMFTLCSTVAFKIYDMDKDGYISNGELFQVLKMMVGNNLKDTQLQQIVDKTIIHADADGDGKISFEEFCAVSCIIMFPSILVLIWALVFHLCQIIVDVRLYKFLKFFCGIHKFSQQ